MGDSDKSLTNLRYNQVTQGMEGFGGGSPMWTPLVLTADGGITQLHGDATAGPGAGNQNLTLATVNSNVGSFTAANITVDAKGRITAASNGSGSGITQLTSDVTAGPGSGSQVATLATVNSNVGSFTNANITVNAKGLITAASNGSGGGSQPNVTQTSTTSAGMTIGTTSYVPVPNLSGTITPSSSSSHVLVRVGIPCFYYVNGSSSYIAFRIKNGSTVIQTFLRTIGADTGTPTGTAEYHGTVVIEFLDTPATTSLITYSVEISNLEFAGGSLSGVQGSTPAWITCMETA